MLSAESLFILGLLFTAGLIFLRLLAGVRHAVVKQAKAQEEARQLAEQACCEAEAETDVHVAKGVMG